MKSYFGDHLSEDSTKALGLGISYGKYKALQREGILPQRKVKIDDPGLPVNSDSGKICKVCGMPIPKGSFRRAYCSDECSDKFYREYNAKRCKQYRTKNK